MLNLDSLLKTIVEYEKQGSQVLPDGSRLVCPVPHVAPRAWLHRIFGGLSEDEISSLDVAACRPVPSALKALYARYNGLALFSDALCIHGLRRSVTRGPAAGAQPFDIGHGNCYERPRNLSWADCVFGSYAADGSLLVARSDGIGIARVDKLDGSVLASWPTLEAALNQEAVRLRAQYDEHGRRLKEDSRGDSVTAAPS